MITTINNKHNKLNVPNLRFPEFQGEWEKYKVSDLLDFYSTNSLSWDKLEYGTDAIQNLHYGLIHVGLSTMIDLSKDKLPNITNGNTPKNYELCQEGDIAFADASEDTNEVAKAVEFYKLKGKDVICGLHTIHGRDNLQKTVVGYKGYAFSSTAFHHQIRRIAQGTKIYSINSKNFSECYIGIPSKEEQKKIATLLRLIDERIVTQNKIIEDLKKLKYAISHILFSSKFTNHLSYIANYCCPLKLRPSRARVCMHMQASKNKKLGWLLFEESALFGNFAATKQTSLPKHGQRYTFSRTADTKSATKLLQQAKNPSDEPRNGR